MSQATVSAACARRRAQPGVDPPQRPMVGQDVGHHGQAQEGVELRGVRHHQDLVDGGGQGGEHALDDAPPAQRHEGLGRASHARALAAGLDDSGDAHRATAPARRTSGGDTVRSSTVEGSPPGVGPPSRTTSSSPSNTARTSSAVVGGGCAGAVGAGRGDGRAQALGEGRGNAMGRMADPDGARSRGDERGDARARAGSTRVSAPGQCRAISSRARGTPRPPVSAMATELTSTRSGLSSGRPLTRKILASASSQCMAAPSP